MQTRVSFDEHIRKNNRVTIAVIVFMFTLLFGLIYAIGLVVGIDARLTLIGALVVTFGYIAFTWGSSTETVLRAAGARRANPADRQEKLLMYKVEEMAIASGLPPPTVYVQDSRDINAFVTGLTPEKSVLVMTRGALEQLNNEEQEGVIAHEMSHILNRDMKLATIIVGVVGAMAILAEIGIRAAFFSRGNRKVHPAFLILAIVGIILAPLLSRLCYLFLSRRREYLADATGARLTRNPHGLANALRKIKGDIPDDPRGSKTVAGLYISNPWKRARRESAFSTHPPLDERIHRLENM